MHYGEIKKCDIANGPGVRVTLFVSGCTNKCPGCFQPQTWDFCYGNPFTSETEDTLLEWLSPAYITGLTLLGGEPFEPQNQSAVVELLRKIKKALPENEFILLNINKPIMEILDTTGFSDLFTIVDE